MPTASEKAGTAEAGKTTSSETRPAVSAESPTPEGAQDVVSPSPQGAEAAVLAAPPAGGRGDVQVRILYPTDRFVLEGHPVLTREPVGFTKTAADEVVKAAIASGIRVVVNDEETLKGAK